MADLRGKYRFDLEFTFIHLTDYTLSQFSLLNDNQKQVVGGYLCYKDANGLIRDKKALANALKFGGEPEPNLKSK